MATISVDQYNDDGTTSRTAGEVLTINGATFTQRSDTRWHATSPASMTGTYSDITISSTLGGRYVVDATNVRWLAYNSGSGNVPAIGTSITQGGVSSSYFLAAYASLTDAPTAIGNAMPASGFIKFREVSGVFTTGALTGIGASATGADVAGWIEVVQDQASGTLVTVPRLGEFETRGTWFYLDNTDGTTAQVLQVPNNGGGSGTQCPGAWIEKATGSAGTYTWAGNVATITLASHGYFVGDDVDIDFTTGDASGETTYKIATAVDANTFTVALAGSGTGGNCSVSQFEFYPGLNNDTANGWHTTDIGSPGLDGANADSRHKFVKSIGTGQMQIAENSTTAATYTTASGATTYTWSANTVTVTWTAHGLMVGEQVYLDFTSGGATANDGVYTILTNATNTFTVALSGSGASGNVTGWARSTISSTAHGYAIGNQVYLNFTSGGVTTDGVYVVRTVATDSFTVNTYTNSASGGNVDIEMTIGYIPTSGLRTRVPNIFLRQCTTGARASNAAPHATIGTRPEFITSSAGAIDSEYTYGDWYFNLLQAYSVHLYHSATFNTYLIAECATALDLDDIGVGQHGALDLAGLSCTSNFAGGTVSNGYFDRGNAPGSSDHDVPITYCKDISFINVRAGIIQFARSTGYSFSLQYCNGITLARCTSINSATISLLSTQNITISDLNWVDRYMGVTNATSASYCVTIGAGSVNTTIDGVAFGFNGDVADVHPYAGIVSYTATVNTIIRNCGTRAAMLSGGTIPLWMMGTMFVSGSNNDTVKIQRCYLTSLSARVGMISGLNTDNNVTHESIFLFQYTTTAGAVTNLTLIPVALNSSFKGIGAALNTVAGQTSIYGTHWMDIFTSDTVGRIVAIMNEETETTASYNSLTLTGASGGFTSVGGLALPAVGDEYITECPYWILGHTALNNTAPVVTGTNVTWSSGSDWGNHDIYYQIDTGGGWNGSWNDLNAATLSSETVSETGFRLKFRIVCNAANTGNLVNFVRIETTSTASAQADNLYTLETVDLTITVKDNAGNNIENAQVAIYDATTLTELMNSDTNASGISTITYEYTGDTAIIVRVRKSSSGTTKYVPYGGLGTITSTGFTTTVALDEDTIVAASVNGTIAGDWTIDTDDMTIRHTADSVVYTVNELYTWLMDTFDESGFMDDPNPITAQTPSEYTLKNGWFIDNSSFEYLKSGAIQTEGQDGYDVHVLTVTGGTYNDPISGDIGKTVNDDATPVGPLLDYEIISAGVSAKWYIRDTRVSPAQIANTSAITITSGTGSGNASGNSVTGESIWSNVYTLGSLVSGTTLDVYQNDTQIAPWWSSGQIDILVKVTEAGVEIDSGNLTIMARKYTTLYDHQLIDASTGRNPVPLVTFSDPNNQTVEGTVSAYSNIAITFGATSEDLGNGNGARPYDVAIDCANRTLTEVYEYLKYVTRSGTGTTLNGVNGEFYTAVGDIRFDYTSEASGPFVETAAITSSSGGTGYIVSVIDTGSTGTLVLRNVHGVFADTDTITSGSTTATVSGTPDTITASEQAPFGTFAGGKFFGARGIYLSNMDASDANNYTLIDSTNTTQSPPLTVSLSVHVENGSGTDIAGAQVFIRKSDVYYNYSSHNTNNSAGDGTFEVNEAIDSDLPQSGWLHVWDASTNTKQEYRYASWSGTSFTLNTHVTGTATSSGSATTLISTSTDFLSADIEEGDTIRNTTDGSWAVIDEVVDADNIVTTALQGGSDNVWESSDSFSVHRLAIDYENTDLVDVPLFNGQTDVDGDISTIYGGSTPVSIVVRIRSNNGVTKYVPFSTSGSITSSGFSLTAILTEDTVAA